MRGEPEEDDAEAGPTSAEADMVAEAPVAEAPNPQQVLKAKTRSAVAALKRNKSAENTWFAKVEAHLDDWTGDDAKQAMQEVIRMYRRWIPMVKELRKVYEEAGVAAWAVSRGPRDNHRPDTEPNHIRAASLYAQAYDTTAAQAKDVMWKYGNY